MHYTSQIFEATGAGAKRVKRSAPSRPCQFHFRHSSDWSTHRVRRQRVQSLPCSTLCRGIGPELRSPNQRFSHCFAAWRSALARWVGCKAWARPGLWVCGFRLWGNSSVPLLTFLSVLWLSFRAEWRHSCWACFLSQETSKCFPSHRKAAPGSGSWVGPEIESRTPSRGQSSIAVAFRVSGDRADNHNSAQ